MWVHTEHFVSKCCGGEVCSVCGKDATHKLGEEVFHDDPRPPMHNLTAYVCCEHYTMILGPYTGCFRDPYND